MNKKQITISPCPSCGGSHRYDLQVTYSQVLLMKPKEIASRKVVTQIFVCPAKQSEFQATFSIKTNSNQSIESLSVNAAMEDNDED